MIDEVWEIRAGAGVGAGVGPARFGMTRSAAQARFGHLGGEIVWVDGTATGEPVRSHPITPGRGIGQVSLGDTRTAVRRRLHRCMTTVAGPDSLDQPEDLFWDDGPVVRYSPDQRLPVSAVVVSAHGDA